MIVIGLEVGVTLLSVRGSANVCYSYMRPEMRVLLSEIQHLLVCLLAGMTLYVEAVLHAQTRQRRPPYPRFSSFGTMCLS